jgi:hypothetical protein
MMTWLVFEDESGQGLRPPQGHTWGHRGRSAKLHDEPPCSSSR